MAKSTLSKLVTAAVAAGVTYEAYAIYERRLNAQKENKIEEGVGVSIKDTPFINGVHHYVQIHGKDKNNPVLLYIHGGPGNAMSAISHAYQKEWEGFFTVALYDQRNCGLSDSAETPLDVNVFVEDLKGVADYIHIVLPEVPIVLFGQSWGSILGLLAAKRYPNTFKAYVGTGQVINIKDNFETSFIHAKDCAKAENNDRLWNALTEVEVRGNDRYFSYAYDSAKQRYGFSSVRYRSTLNLMKMIYDDFTACPYMNLQDCVKSGIASFYIPKVYQNFIRSNAFMDIDIEKEGKDLSIPVYLIEGDNDWEAPYPLAKKWYDELQTSVKKWLTLDKSGHLVQYDNLPELTGYLWGIRKELFE